MHFDLTSAPINSLRFLLLSMMIDPKWKLREPLESMILRMSRSGQRIIQCLKRAGAARRSAGKPEITSLYEILACQTDGIEEDIDELTLEVIVQWLKSLDPEFELGSTFSPKLIEAIGLAQEGVQLTPLWWQEEFGDIRDWHRPTPNELDEIIRRLHAYKLRESMSTLQPLDDLLKSNNNLEDLRTSLNAAQQFLTMHDAENGPIR